MSLAQYPKIVESKNGGGVHTLCPNRIPGDSPNVEDIQDGTPGLLMVFLCLWKAETSWLLLTLLPH